MPPLRKTVKDFGFTVIELLIVISVIGVVAGVALSSINKQQTSRVAESAAIKANLEKTAAAIQAYYEAEDRVYPDAGDTNNPLGDGADNAAVLQTYISKWPDNYVYNVSADGTTFSIYTNDIATGKVFKVNPKWHKARTCDISTNNTDVNECVAVCSDKDCNSPEWCTACPQACNSCGPRCGDGSCNGVETSQNCPADCHISTPPFTPPVMPPFTPPVTPPFTPPVQCPNGVCSSGLGENCINCPSDCSCPCTGNGGCMQYNGSCGTCAVCKPKDGVGMTCQCSSVCPY